MLSGLYMWGDAATNMVIPDKAGGRFENTGGGIDLVGIIFHPVLVGIGLTNLQCPHTRLVPTALSE